MAAKPSIAVLDYGMGNRRSVEKALEHNGARALVTNDHRTINEAQGLVLPGVGAFPKAMDNLRELELDRVIDERLSAGVPILGICLGLQLLFESSTENEGAEGLNLLRGPVDRLDARGLKVPHIGWTPVAWTRRTALNEGLPNPCPFYLVHSFAARSADDQDVLGTAEYGESFVAAVERGNVFGVQFHPEKSSTHGLRLLENFAGICSTVGAPS